MAALALVSVLSASAFQWLSLLAWSLQGSASLGSADAARCSLGFGAVGTLYPGLIIGVFATAIALWAVRYRTRLGAWIETLSWATHALPAVVVGLALVFFGANITPWIYQTTWMLVIAYLILFLPNALAAISTPIAQAPKDLEDVSQSLGVPANRTLFKVVLPIAFPGILAELVWLHLLC